MKTLLKYRLVPFEKALAFQVIEMDEAQRATNGHFSTFRTSSFAVHSDTNTQLLTESVCLRGRLRSDDSKISTLTFNSNQERDEYAQKVHQSLKEWQQNNGFLGVKPNKSIVEDDFTYTL